MGGVGAAPRRHAARWRSDAWHDQSSGVSRMNVSVIICAYSMERWEELVAAVQSCFDQTRAPEEVIVVIDYNEELRARAVNEFSNVIVTVNSSVKGLSGARNAGVQLAHGDVVVFLDDDAYAEPQWLENLVRPFDDERVAGVGGWIVPHWPGEEPSWFPETFYWVLGCSYAGLPPDLSHIRNPIGSNMALRKHVVDRVGGFSSGLGRISDALLGGEETELCIRYSDQFRDDYFVLARGAIVHHRVPQSRLTFHYFWSRCWSEGLSKAVIASLVGSGAGLAAERAHLLRSLPREVAHSVVRAVREPSAMLRRIGFVAIGSATTVAGFLWGRRSLRGSPGESPDATKLSRAEKPEWMPIALVEMSTDDVDAGAQIRAKPGQRVWVEVRRAGQIVGIREVVNETVTTTTAALREVTEGFSDVVPSALGDVADERLARASVIVPTICEDPEELSELVASLLQLDYPDFEVIVVDNRSSAKKTPLSFNHDSARLRVIDEVRPGVSAARNTGATIATGEFLAFTDDDALVDRGWLRALGARFALDPSVDAVGGLVLPAELETQAQLWFEEFYGGFSQSFQASTVSLEMHDARDGLFPYNAGRFGAGCNMAVRRSAFMSVGGFDVELGVGTPTRGGEDLAMFLNVLFGGGSLAFEPGALVRHHHRRSQSAFMRQVFGYGVGLGAMYSSVVRKDPRHLWAMAKRVPAAIRLLVRPRTERSVSSMSSYPSPTLAVQIMGLACGPVAYVRSVRWGRRFHG
ncbi:MAG: glycosyltransferase [Acidimicrobiales bacterium]